MKCETCKGGGWSNHKAPDIAVCPTCGGTGWKNWPPDGKVCIPCDGTGNAGDAPCYTCIGTGTQPPDHKPLKLPNGYEGYECEACRWWFQSMDRFTQSHTAALSPQTKPQESTKDPMPCNHACHSYGYKSCSDCYSTHYPDGEPKEAKKKHPQSSEGGGNLPTNNDTTVEEANPNCRCTPAEGGINTFSCPVHGMGIRPNNAAPKSALYKEAMERIAAEELDSAKILVLQMAVATINARLDYLNDEVAAVSPNTPCKEKVWKECDYRYKHTHSKPPIDPERCCDNGYFSDEHDCLKQSGDTPSPERKHTITCSYKAPNAPCFCPLDTPSKSMNWNTGIDITAYQYSDSIHEAPTSSDGQGVSEDTMPLDEILWKLCHKYVMSATDAKDQDLINEAKQAIQSLISSEKVKELKAARNVADTSRREEVIRDYLEQRIKEIEG